MKFLQKLWLALGRPVRTVIRTAVRAEVQSVLAEKIAPSLTPKLDEKMPGTGALLGTVIAAAMRKHSK